MIKKLSAPLAAILLAILTPAFAAGPDNLLEMTTKIEMPGMNMPAQTNQVCSPKGKENEAAMPPDGDCKMTDFKRSGNKSTFRMVCNHPEPMTGTGEFVTDGPDAYHGKMHMTGKVNGEAMDMTTSYSSKRIGSCTYEDTAKKMKNTMDAASASACRERMDTMEWNIFIGKTAVEYCKPYRNEFCGKVSKLSDKMRDPANYDPKNKNWKEAAEACGQNTESVMKDACGRAVGSKNWDFVADNCPAEAKPLAQQYCEGRDYTARRESPYASICSKYASAPVDTPKSKGGIVDALSGKGTVKGSASDAVEMGTKALKGLFNF